MARKPNSLWPLRSSQQLNDETMSDGSDDTVSDVMVVFSSHVSKVRIPLLSRVQFEGNWFLLDRVVSLRSIHVRQLVTRQPLQSLENNVIVKLEYINFKYIHSASDKY